MTGRDSIERERSLDSEIRAASSARGEERLVSAFMVMRFGVDGAFESEREHEDLGVGSWVWPCGEVM